MHISFSWSYTSEVTESLALEWSVDNFIYIKLLGLLSWFQLIKARAKVDKVFLLRIIKLVSLAPVIGDSIGKDLPILVERALGDGLVTSFTGLQLGSGVFVPE